LIESILFWWGGIFASLPIIDTGDRKHAPSDSCTGYPRRCSIGLTVAIILLMQLYAVKMPSFRHR